MISEPVIDESAPGEFSAGRAARRCPMTEKTDAPRRRFAVARRIRSLAQALRSRYPSPPSAASAIFRSLPALGARLSESFCTLLFHFAFIAKLAGTCAASRTLADAASSALALE